MLTVRRDHTKPPIGGHYFPGHGGLRAPDVDALLALILNHRAKNALPRGNPEHELATYYRKVAPWLVRETPEEDMTTKADHLAEWIMRAVRTSPKRMDNDQPLVAKRRALCQQCPWHDPRPSLNLKDPYQAAASVRASLLSSLTHPLEDGACRWHHWPISIASTLEAPESLALPPSPEMCWVGRSPP